LKKYTKQLLRAFLLLLLLLDLPAAKWGVGFRKKRQFWAFLLLCSNNILYLVLLSYSKPARL